MKTKLENEFSVLSLICKDIYAYKTGITLDVPVLVLATLLTNFSVTALAVNECGPEVPGQDTITCNQSSHPNGIQYIGTDGLTLNLDNAAMTVSGSPGGVYVDGNSTTNGHITINAIAFNSITSVGDTVHGISADMLGADSNGNATAIQSSGTVTIHSTTAETVGLFSRTNGISGDSLSQMDGGTITATGLISRGLMSSNTNSAATGSATSLMTQGLVNSDGYGIYALHHGLGSALAQIDGGTAETNGLNNSHGVFASIDNANSSASATSRNTGGAITTVGDSSRGVIAQHAGMGASSVEMSGGTVTTSGEASHGLISNATNANNTAISSVVLSSGGITTTGTLSRGMMAVNAGTGVSSAEMSGGTITTSGQSSHGIMSDQINAGGDADATVTLSNGNIITTGVSSHGILARNAGAGDAIITATGGTITVSGTNSNGVSAISAGGNVQVTVDTQVTGGTSGSNAVRTETAAGQTSTITIGGSADISSAGSRVIFNDEGDSLTTIAAGAQVSGEILLSDGSDTLEIQGADISNITLFDGGDNMDSSDGSIDRLILQNQNTVGTIDGATLTNWEEISLVNSTLEVDDLVTGTVNISGGTTTLGGASAITDLLGSSADETVTVTGNTAVTDDIEGAGGADTITINTTGTVQLVDGGAGEDTINLLSGTVDLDVLGGLEDDTITLNGATVTGNIDGGAGEDTINLLSGTVDLDVLGGLEDDTITLNGATVTGNIDGGAGDDTLFWQSGSVAELHGGDDSDTVEVSAAEYDNTQILDGGGDNNDETNGVIDQLTLRGLDIDLADNGTISNWEVIVFDASAIRFTDGTTATSAALFLTNGSILNGEDEFNHSGNLTIDGGSRFRGAGGGLGSYQVQELANNGTVDLQDAAVGDTLSTLGDYSGSGALLLDVDLAQASADTLVVGGDVSGGRTTIAVQEIELDPAPRGSGASSRIGDKILLVDVVGATAEGDFILGGGSISKGALSYLLELENSQWLLVPGLSSPGAASGAAPSILLDAFTKLPTFSQRTGGRQWLWRENETEGRQAAGRGVWLRFSGDHIDASPEIKVGAFNDTYHYDSDIRNTQAGIETRLQEGRNGLWILGLTVQYGTVDAVVSNRLGRGSVEATGYGAGLTATWQGNNGLYLDTQGQFNWIDSNIASAADGPLVDDHASTAQSLSLELGRSFSINGRHSIIPQMQFSWGRIDGDRFTDSLGNNVDPGANHSLTARFGMAYNFQLKDADGKYRKNLYVVGNLLPNFSDAGKVRIDSMEITSKNDPTLAEIGLGGSIALSRNTSLYAEGSRREAVFDDSDDDYGYSFSVGMNVHW